MATYTSIRPTLGGLYEAGFFIRQELDMSIDLNIRDDEDGLNLRIDSVVNDENGEEENRQTESHIQIPEDERSDFARYLRQVADMIDRDRPFTVREEQVSPVGTPRDRYPVGTPRHRSPSPQLRGSSVSPLGRGSPSPQLRGSSVSPLGRGSLSPQLRGSSVSPVRTSESLDTIISHGLLLSFISFEEITNMLIHNKIERYIIDPELQYLTTSPNVVLTMFGKNGITYLVKARYDQRSNQIFQPYTG
jgi:hypothetical protein